MIAPVMYNPKPAYRALLESTSEFFAWVHAAADCVDMEVYRTIDESTRPLDRATRMRIFGAQAEAVVDDRATFLEDWEKHMKTAGVQRSLQVRGQGSPSAMRTASASRRLGTQPTAVGHSTDGGWALNRRRLGTQRTGVGGPLTVQGGGGFSGGRFRFSNWYRNPPARSFLRNPGVSCSLGSAADIFLLQGGAGAHVLHRHDRSPC